MWVHISLTSLGSPRFGLSLSSPQKMKVEGPRIDAFKGLNLTRTLSQYQSKRFAVYADMDD